MKVVELFSGIGSQAKALKNQNIEHEILMTSEWDINAIMAYNLIHNGETYNGIYDNLSKKELVEYLFSKYTLSNNGKDAVEKKQLKILSVEVLRKLRDAIEQTKNIVSITDLDYKKFKELKNQGQKVDLLTYSFPCQDLSNMAHFHGESDGIDRDKNTRSGLLWQVENILFDLKKHKQDMPKVLLMENVSALVSSRHITNFEEWQSSLKNMGYINYHFILNSKYFNTPQARRRVYMISVYVGKNKNLERIIEEELENIRQDFNNNRYLTAKQKDLKDILKLDYRNKKYKKEAIEAQPNDTISRKQIYINNKKLFSFKEGIYFGEVPTLTTKQDRHPNSGVLDFKLGSEDKSDFRYLTPREAFLLMGFEEKDIDAIYDNNFLFRNKSFYSEGKLLKFAGNSIVVGVLEEIFVRIKRILHILDEYKK